MAKDLPIVMTKAVFDEGAAMEHSQRDRALTEKLLVSIKNVWEWSMIASQGSARMFQILDILTDREKDLLFAVSETWRELETHRKTVHPKYKEVLGLIKELEWSGHSPGLLVACPSCAAIKGRPHRTDCKLALAINSK